MDLSSTERMNATRVFTVGHSTRPLDELVALLRDHGIAQLVDVRRFPRSRRLPQFNQDALARDLREEGTAYLWMGAELGGFRAGGYELHMDSPGFQKGIAQLSALAARAATAIMCAEVVWFRCHRRFIARRLVTLGHRVTHIVRQGTAGYEEPLRLDSVPT